MSAQIVGVSGSPIKNSNTDRLIQAVLQASGLEYEFFKLSTMDVKACLAVDAKDVVHTPHLLET